MKQEENLYYALFAKFSKGIGAVRAKEILFSHNGISKLDFHNEAIKQRVHKELELIEKYKVKMVTILDYNYPKNLLEIPDSPTVLYYYGELKEQFLFSVVGTRKPSKYGIETTKMVVAQLCESGVAIVSGMAYGIDSIAHEIALEHKSPTYAVLGCGIDVSYPRSNMWMRDAIINRGGAVISEFPIGTQAMPSNFPIRNRIVSAISQGVLIIEAGERSGSLITAKLALDQGKNIYTIPGSIFGGSFKGNHHLIRLGAGLIENGYQILEEYPYAFKSNPKLEKMIKERAGSDIVRQTKHSSQLGLKDFSIFSNPESLNKETLEPKQEHYAKLTSEEFIVYQLLESKKSLDDLSFQTEYSAGKLLALTTSLIMKGMILEEGGFYRGL